MVGLQQHDSFKGEGKTARKELREAQQEGRHGKARQRKDRINRSSGGGRHRWVCDGSVTPAVVLGSHVLCKHLTRRG